MNLPSVFVRQYHTIITMILKMKPITTCVAIITALVMHHLSLTLANHTIQLFNASSAGFSLQLITKHESPDQSIRRGSDGFLYLQHNPNTPVETLTPLRPVMVQTTRIHVGSGHGARQFTVRLDPYERLTWLQCKPCNPMAKQAGPLFDPALSPTFRAVAGTTTACHPPYLPETGTGLCVFHLTRTTGSKLSVTGYLSTDYFAISNGAIMRGYTFGCTHFTYYFESMDVYAGALATGRSPASFVMQATALGQTQFSYCLSGETDRQGVLQFAADFPRSSRYRTTQILPAAAQDGDDEAAYYVGLVGVSLGGQRLDGVRPEMFARRKGGQGGATIDLATPLTVMIQEAYRVVEDAVWSDLQRHGAVRVNQSGYGGLCVQATEAIKGHLPSMSLHFAEEEATLEVSSRQLFLIMDGKQGGQIACLAMTPGRRTVIGAFQQADTRFIYDLKDDKLSFAPESCHRETVQVT